VRPSGDPRLNGGRGAFLMAIFLEKRKERNLLVNKGGMTFLSSRVGKKSLRHWVSLKEKDRERSHHPGKGWRTSEE